jgi:protein-arginine kinase activator protein McsA
MVRHQEDIDSLDRELQVAIKQEEYERAAVLRDEIKRIKSIMDSDKRGE